MMGPLERTREMLDSIFLVMFFCAVVTFLEAGSAWLRRRRHARDDGEGTETARSGQKP